MQTPGGLNPAISWSKVDVLTPSQRITAEIQIRGRLRDTINDPEPVFHLRNVSAEPLIPGAVALNGVPEGLFSKAMVGGIRTIDIEPPPPDPAKLTSAFDPPAPAPIVSMLLSAEFQSAGTVHDVPEIMKTWVTSGPR